MNQPSRPGFWPAAMPWILLLCLPACETKQTPDFAADVVPIFSQKCAACHSEGGIAPIEFADYASIAAVRLAVQAQVEAELMPPWPPADDCNRYAQHRGLTANERETLLAWLEAGAPGGRNSDAAKVQAPNVTTIRRDLELAMPEAYLPTQQPDDYRCIPIAWPLTDTTFVTGFQIEPGETKVVHHVIAFLMGPEMVTSIGELDAEAPDIGYTCFGGPGVTRQMPKALGAWVPGGGSMRFATGTGLSVAPGSTVVLQIHYNTLNGMLPDRSKVAFEIESEVAAPAVTLVWADPVWILSEGKGMHIPAGESAVRHSYSADPNSLLSLTDHGLDIGRPLWLHLANLHMHKLGTSAALYLDRSDGSRECLLSIPRWDFDWQGGYPFAAPVTWYPGDRLTIECQWDNGDDNQPIVAGTQQQPQDVFWGEGTNDEMCLGGFYITQAE